ncbi:tumor necrosis factor ligand superfamily member 9 [Arvicanthis niloticus]|uniref:tumor necrosis factor ligand superfamily member 9 n=1 Tax=Arvicanthis niloticus TaxID=61156 RepID=UPI001486DA0E|nr:tumor necrosis factor ligand superfamily member 9 [Arvicanthis niloticus]
MDQYTIDVENTRDAGHPSVTARPSDAALLRDTGLSADAALLADTVRPTIAALRTDASCPAVNVRDPKTAWPPALHFCSRHPRLSGLGALVLLLLVACVPIFTRTQSRPALTITTSPDLGISENIADQVTPVPHIGCPNTTKQGFPVFAKLLAKNQALLSNTTLNWHSQNGAGSVYLSHGLRYEEDKRELVVDSPGLYYVFLELKLHPTSTNTGHRVQGWVSLVLQATPQVNDLDNLTLTVELFPCSMENKLVDGSWSHLLFLKAGHRLSVGLRAYLHGAQDAYRDWELSYPDTTSFGLFLVKPDTPRE